MPALGLHGGWPVSFPNIAGSAVACAQQTDSTGAFNAAAVARMASASCHVICCTQTVDSACMQCQQLRRLFSTRPCSSSSVLCGGVLLSQLFQCHDIMAWLAQHLLC